jgi:hypothetical protein
LILCVIDQLIQDWGCPTCTFINEARSSRCQMCNTARPAAVALPQSVSTTTEAAPDGTKAPTESPADATSPKPGTNPSPPITMDLLSSALAAALAAANNSSASTAASGTAAPAASPISFTILPLPLPDPTGPASALPATTDAASRGSDEVGAKAGSDADVVMDESGRLGGSPGFNATETSPGTAAAASREGIPASPAEAGLPSAPTAAPAAGPSAPAVQQPRTFTLLELVRHAMTHDEAEADGLVRRPGSVPC